MGQERLLMNGAFSDILKLARVTPIFTSVSKNDANNYRPIPVISISSRILERLVHDKLFDFLKLNRKLICNQSVVFFSLMLFKVGILPSTWY